MAAKPGGARGRTPQQTDKRPVARRAPRKDTLLSPDRIVAKAVDLLDAEGVDGLTMRRLADRLGVGAMSLYWHVTNKEQVLDLALDAVLVYRIPESEDAAAGWRAPLVHMLADWRATMLRHPWSAALLPRRALGASMLGRLERLSRVLSDAGVAPVDLNVAVWSLWNYVMGATVTLASFDRPSDDRASAQRDLGAYPTLQQSRLLLDDDWEGTFRSGLDILLDGIAAGAKKTR